MSTEEQQTDMRTRALAALTANFTHPVIVVEDRWHAQLGDVLVAKLDQRSGPDEPIRPMPGWSLLPGTADLVYQILQGAVPNWPAAILIVRPQHPEATPWGGGGL